MSAMAGKRLDPETGAAATYRQLVATYKKGYNKRQIQDWGGEGLVQFTNTEGPALARNIGKDAGHFDG